MKREEEGAGQSGMHKKKYKHTVKHVHGLENKYIQVISNGFIKEYIKRACSRIYSAIARGETWSTIAGINGEK